MGMRRTLCLLSLTVALGAFGYEKCVDGLEVGRILEDMKTLVENPELITL